MKIISVDELISTWSEEEREKLAELIKESRAREKKNEESKLDHKKRLERMSDNEIGVIVENNWLSICPDAKIGLS